MLFGHSDEFQTLQLPFPVESKPTRTARWFRQQPLPFVKPQGLDVYSRPPDQFATGVLNKKKTYSIKIT